MAKEIIPFGDTENIINKFERYKNPIFKKM